MEKTLFEKIIDREIPADIVHETGEVLVFRDINPQAPVHLLVIPKRRIARLGEAGEADIELLGQLLHTAAEVARRQGYDKTGFRVVINHGSDGGETVPHLHVHLLAGRPLKWPPG